MFNKESVHGDRPLFVPNQGMMGDYFFVGTKYSERSGMKIIYNELTVFKKFEQRKLQTFTKLI
jgi:hypothetical protein